MKKTLLLFFIGTLLLSCKQSISEKDISKMNGYWEIEKVELPDGNMKDYKVNETIDFFQIKDKAGFRQKVMPQLDGKYLTNGIKENISISNENGDYFINYSTNYGKWKEEIIEIKDSVLVLKNKEQLEYHYKRQIPFSIK
jgi:hypothetical protein